MQTGVRNNSLVFPMMTKINLWMDHNVDYNFELMVGSFDNPNAINRSITYQIRFAPPSIDDIVPDESRATQCERLDISSNSFVRKDSRTVIDFTKEEWSSSDISALQTFDLMSTASRSPCGQGEVLETILLYYLFDGLPFN